MVIGYVAYVFLSFSRLEDHLKLEIQNAPAGAPYGAEIYGEVADAAPVGSELTVVSYNIGFGAYSDDYTFFMDGGKESWARSKEAINENIGGAMETLRQYSPDIVMIQEVDVDGTRTYHVDERSIVVPGVAVDKNYSYDYAQNYDSPFLFYPILQPHGANKAGIMTFAGFRINDAERISLPIETGVSKVLDLDRCYSKSRVDVDNGAELVIYNLHLSAYTSDPTTAENQLDILVQPFDEADPKASCRNPDKPYEPGDFVVTVDGFIRSANVKVIESDVIDTGFKYSDHNPVYMKIVLE